MAIATVKPRRAAALPLSVLSEDEFAHSWDFEKAPKPPKATPPCQPGERPSAGGLPPHEADGSQEHPERRDRRPGVDADFAEKRTSGAHLRE